MGLFDDLREDFLKPDKPQDPVEWVKEVTGYELWSKQQEILRSVQQNKQTAVQSCHGSGKSMLASLLAAWWVDTHPYDDTIVITTAPSKNQVHGILWENIRKVHRDAKLPGEVQLSDNWIINRRTVGQGRKPQDYSNSVFQGIHREFVLFILDEACGISPGLWNAAITNTTSRECRILAIGNPDDPSSEFARVCQRDPKWNTIKISLWETPNFTDEVVSEVAKKNLVDDSYLETARTSWGESSPIWASKVDGEFPTVDEFAVCPVDWVLRAFERHQIYMDSPPPVVDEFSGPPRKILGVDVARYGKDKTVIATRIGDIFTDIEGFTMRDNVEVANLVMKRMNKTRDKAVIDLNGIGSGVFDILRSRGYKVEGFNAGAKTKEKDISRKLEFTRVRSAAWWKLREALDPTNDPRIAFPDVETENQELLNELTTPRWEQVLNGQIQVEGKDDIRKRLDRSTDYADAVIMAWWAKPHVLNSIEDSGFKWIDDKEAAREVEEGAFSWNLDDDWRDGLDPSRAFS